MLLHIHTYVTSEFDYVHREWRSVKKRTESGRNVTTTDTDTNRTDSAYAQFKNYCACMDRLELEHILYMKNE